MPLGCQHSYLVRTSVDMAKLTDSGSTRNRSESVSQNVGAVEFVQVVKQEHGYDEKEYKKILRSEIEKESKKPRNIFLIYRSLVKQYLMNYLSIKGFTEISEESGKVS